MLVLSFVGLERIVGTDVIVLWNWRELLRHWCWVSFGGVRFAKKKKKSSGVVTQCSAKKFRRGAWRHSLECWERPSLQREGTPCQARVFDIPLHQPKGPWQRRRSRCIATVAGFYSYTHILSPSSIAVLVGLPALLPPNSLKTKRTERQEK